MERPLVAVFLQHAPSSGEVDHAELERCLTHAFDEAKSQWPGVAVDGEQFAAHLAARVGSERPFAESLAALHAGDLYLTRACEDGDAAAIQAFDTAFLARLGEVLSRFSLDPALVDEVRQGLRAKLFAPSQGRAKIADYQGRGSLAGWVRAAASRMALDLIEQQKRFVPTADPEMGLPLVTPEPELDYLKTRYKGEFQAAFASALAGLPPPDRTLLKLYYLDGLNLAQIAQLDKVHESTISRRLDAAREALLDATRRGLAARLQVPADEVESLMRLAASRLDISLRTMLR